MPCLVVPVASSSLQILWLDAAGRDVTKRHKSCLSVDTQMNLVVTGSSADEAGPYTCAVTWPSGTLTVSQTNPVYLHGSTPCQHHLPCSIEFFSNYRTSY